MANLILDYAVKFSQRDTLQSVSLGFLKSVGAVVKATQNDPTAVLTRGLATDTDHAVVTFTGIFAKGSSLSADAVADPGAVANTVIYQCKERQTADEFAQGFMDAIISVTKINASHFVKNGVLTFYLSGTSTINKLQLSNLDDSGLISIPHNSIIEAYNKEDVRQISPKQAHEIAGLFDAGLNKVSLIYIDDISKLTPLIERKETDFFTLHNTSDFTTDEFLNASLNWQGVRGFAEVDRKICKDNANIKNTCAFYVADSGKNAYKSFYSFGSLLSAGTWRNQQYISTLSPDGAIVDLGAAEGLFDDRISFFLSDLTNGTRLGFFVAGGRSITAPYVEKEIELMLQHAMTKFLTVNQPFNVELERAELERIGQAKVNYYIDLGYLDPASENDIKISKSAEAFKVNGKLTTAPAVALWRLAIDSMQV